MINVVFASAVSRTKILPPVVIESAVRSRASLIKAIRRPSPLIEGVVEPPEEPIPWDITREQPAYHIKAEIAFRNIDVTQYLGLFLSGGRAPEYLRYNQDLLRITRHFFETKKPVGVICHGVEILAAAGVLQGRTLTTVAKCALATVSEKTANMAYSRLIASANARLVPSGPCGAPELSDWPRRGRGPSHQSSCASPPSRSPSSAG